MILFLFCVKSSKTKRQVLGTSTGLILSLLQLLLLFDEKGSWFHKITICCPLINLSFSNLSVGPGTLIWDFGIPGKKNFVS